MVTNMHIFSKWRFFVIMGVSLGVGIFMASFMLPGHLQDWAQSIYGLEEAHRILHLPTYCLLVLWRRYLHLPPRGDAEFGLYKYAIVAQWIIVGLLISWLMRKKRTPVQNKV